MRTGEVEYESDYYHQWFVPPGAMLTSALERWLGAAAVFKQVTPPGARVDAGCTLGGLVTALHGDYRAQPGKAVLGLDLYLVRVDSSQEVLFRKAYLREVELAAKSPEGLARGLNEALKLILADLEADLRQLGSARGT
jgi:cholesterol transport system auxiliary component